MPYLKPEQFKAELRSKNYRPVYIFAGEEMYFLEESWRQLEKALALDSLNCETFFGADASVDNVILGLQTLPFMSDKRLLVVKEAHRMKSGEADKLAECIKVPVESSCLVLLWPERLKRDAKSSNLFDAAEKAGAIVEFKTPYERELPAWITAHTAQYGKKISSSAVQCLIQESGSSLLDLHNEIEKLALFTGAAKEIKLEDAQAMSGHTRQANLNQLAEAVEAGKRGDALRVLESLLEEGEIPLKILAALYRTIRRLLAAESLSRESGCSAQEIRQQLNLHAYFDRNFFANRSGRTLEGLKKDMELLLRADRELKTSARPEKFVFEDLIISLS